MKRTFTRFVVISVAILSAELLVQYLTTQMPSFTRPGQPYYSSLMRMALIVAVFYPSFLIVSDIMERVAKMYVKKTKKVANGWWRGMIVCYTIALLLLLWGFAKVWYGQDLFMDIWHTLTGWL
jgi:hypothetical protein